jgi:hypothetical protein
LAEAGVPISGEAGVGYSIMEGYRLPPVMFTKEEARTFITAEKLMEKFTDFSTQSQYQSAMFKVKAVLRTRKNRWWKTWKTTLKCARTTNRSQTEQQYARCPAQIISEKKICQDQLLPAERRTRGSGLLNRWAFTMKITTGIPLHTAICAAITAISVPTASCNVS